MPHYRTSPEPGNAVSIAEVPEAARILRLVIDYARLGSTEDADAAVGLPRARRIYDPFLVNALADLLDVSKAHAATQEVSLDQLAWG